MAAISLGVAFISFLVGIVVRITFGWRFKYVFTVFGRTEWACSCMVNSHRFRYFFKDNG